MIPIAGSTFPTFNGYPFSPIAAQWNESLAQLQHRIQYKIAGQARALRLMRNKPELAGGTGPTEI
jgi:hypothetical protein